MLEWLPGKCKVIVKVVKATDLKNVKPLVKRISVKKPHVREMSPYLVITMNHSNGEEVTPPILHAGRNPEFNFTKTFWCLEDDLVENTMNLKVEIRHRQKAKIRTSSSPILINQVSDRLIGVVMIRLSNEPMISESLSCDVIVLLTVPFHILLHWQTVYLTKEFFFFVSTGIAGA